MVRSAYTLRANEDDFGRAGTLVCKVWNDAQRGRIVDQVSGSLLGRVLAPVFERAFQYWKNSTPRPASGSKKGCAPAAHQGPPKA